MSDQPIIFSGPMILAIDAGRKTMTRRVLKEQPQLNGVWYQPFPHEPRNWQLYNSTVDSILAYAKTPYAVGDRLWVREALEAYNLDLGGSLGLSEPITKLDRARGDVSARYAADKAPCVEAAGFDLVWCWKRDRLAARFCPRSFSRFTLTVIAVKVERLMSISEADAMAEGVEPILVPPDGGSAPHVEGFRVLWNSLHGPDADFANPWVGAYTFTVEKRNIDG